MANNKFILKYLDSFHIEERSGKIYYLVTQYYPDKTLHHLIARKLAVNEEFNSNELKESSKQLLNGIKYLHSVNIIHRDIKPGNIFINGPSLVIGDLGHAKHFNIAVSNRISRFSATYGTDSYNAPESEDRGYSSKIDIWSFGCVLFEMIKLRRLFDQKTKRELNNKIYSFDAEKDIQQANIEPFFDTILKK
jgi:serine/threonine protein kinase